MTTTTTPEFELSPVLLLPLDVVGPLGGERVVDDTTVLGGSVDTSDGARFGGGVNGVG